MTTRWRLERPWIRHCVLSLVVAVGFVGTSFAQQFDAPYLALEKMNKDKWAAEDKQISEKLAALERKFGKKPNIVYILADDVGWGEVGWQGGGKHRGTPTPEIDILYRAFCTRSVAPGEDHHGLYRRAQCDTSRRNVECCAGSVCTG